MERILCAAVHFNDHQKHQEQPDNIEEGFVIAGRRHSDCYTTLKILDPKDRVIYSLRGDGQHGFITSTNRFVGRKEAWEIADKAGQIVYGKEAVDTSNLILISENLY